MGPTPTVGSRPPSMPTAGLVPPPARRRAKSAGRRKGSQIHHGCNQIEPLLGSVERPRPPPPRRTPPAPPQEEKGAPSPDPSPPLLLRRRRRWEPEAASAPTSASRGSQQPSLGSSASRPLGSRMRVGSEPAAGGGWWALCAWGPRAHNLEPEMERRKQEKPPPISATSPASTTAGHGRPPLLARERRFRPPYLLERGDAGGPCSPRAARRPAVERIEFGSSRAASVTATARGWFSRWARRQRSSGRRGLDFGEVGIGDLAGGHCCAVGKKLEASVSLGRCRLGGFERLLLDERREACCLPWIWSSKRKGVRVENEGEQVDFGPRRRRGGVLLGLRR
ncbi:unnamed protein product [Urochloa humidicola]